MWRVSKINLQTARPLNRENVWIIQHYPTGIIFPRQNYILNHPVFYIFRLVRFLWHTRAYVAKKSDSTRPRATISHLGQEKTTFESLFSFFSLLKQNDRANRKKNTRTKNLDSLAHIIKKKQILNQKFFENQTLWSCSRWIEIGNCVGPS